MSRTKDWLLERGWRHIGNQGSAQLFDHPRHQPDRRGCFTTIDAIKHQKQYEKDGCCDCIKPENE